MCSAPYTEASLKLIRQNRKFTAAEAVAWARIQKFKVDNTAMAEDIAKVAYPEPTDRPSRPVLHLPPSSEPAVAPEQQGDLVLHQSMPPPPPPSPDHPPPALPIPEATPVVVSGKRPWLLVVIVSALASLWLGLFLVIRRIPKLGVTLGDVWGYFARRIQDAPADDSVLAERLPPQKERIPSPTFTRSRRDNAVIGGMTINK